jgi:hypothetical protein
MVKLTSTKPASAANLSGVISQVKIIVQLAHTWRTSARHTNQLCSLTTIF